MARSARTATASSPASRRDIRAYFAAAEPSLRLRLDPRARCSALYASGDSNPLRQHGNRLRRDLREPDLRRRRHQLLDPPVDPVRRRRPRDRRSTAATACSTTCARRRTRASRTSTIPARSCSASARDFDLTPRAARLGQRQPPVVRQHRGAAGAAPAKASIPQRHRLGLLRLARSGGRSMTQNIVFRALGARCCRRARASATCSPTPSGDGRYYSVLFNAILSF